MDTGVAPLLLGRAGSVARAPSRHPAIIGLTEKTDRYARYGSLGFQTLGFRAEPPLPFRRVAGPTSFDTAVRTEARVGRRVLPALGTEFTDFRSTLPLPRFTEPRVVLRWPEAHPYCVRTNKSVARRSATAVGRSITACPACVSTSLEWRTAL